MTRVLVLDPADVPPAPLTRVAVLLRLDDEKPPVLDRHGFYDGQWVHTPRTVVVDWSGPARWWCDYRKAMIEGTTNAHRVEGRLILGGPWPVVETTLVYPKPKYDWSPRRLAGKPVLFTVRRHTDIQPGPLSRFEPRSINLEDN